MNNDDKLIREKLEAKFEELFWDLDDELPDYDDELETILLDDENGNENEYEIMDLIEYEGEDYVVLLPSEDCEDAEEAVILRLFDEDDEQTYARVDDYDILMTIFGIFKEKFKDDFIFAD